MTTLPFDLTGHVAIVTGANHGIGTATARALAECGARVLVTYLRVHGAEDSGRPETYKTVRELNAVHILEAIRERGGHATAVEADLADPQTPSRLFDLAETELGPVDILVNNASCDGKDTFASESRDMLGRRLDRVSTETFDRQFAVDARGGATMIAEFAQRHAERGATWGRIIGLTSGGPLGFPGEVSYGAAKAALENYTMSAAFELADLGITANIVYPPVTDTGWVTDEVIQHMEDRTDLLRIAQPEDVANVIAYLASDHARLITGNIVHLR